MASEGAVQREESGLEPDAPVDWPATWRRNVSQPMGGTLVLRRWERRLRLPENLLAHRVLHELATDAAHAARTTATPIEAAPLRQLHERATRQLARPPWRNMGPVVREDATLRQAEQRIRLRLAPFPAYGQLLAWWQQWSGWHQPESGARSSSTDPWDPALEADWLFELLLLFEILALLSRHLPVHQLRSLNENSQQPLFLATTPEGPLLVYYQTGSMFAAQRSLDEIWGIPDIVLQLPGVEPSYVILDAKNYGPDGHTQAIYKMLGYLYQFGYDPGGTHTFDRVHAGVLAFPTEEREGRGLRNWQQELPGAQAVMSFVHPLLPDEQYTGLDEFVGWLLGRMRD
jgi:hypothetical protein